MSFILDALKKSESDRQRQSGPALFEVRVAAPRSALPPWAIAIAALFAVNFALVIWMLMRHPAPTPAAQASAASVTQPAASAAPAPAPAPASALRQPPAAVAAPVVTQATTQPTTPAAAPAPTSSATVAAQAVAETPSSPPERANPEDYAPAAEAAPDPFGHVTRGTGAGVPLYQQSAAAAQLPQLRLDLHAYAEKAADRWAMINMHKVHEGDSLPEGPHVDHITPEGVVLSYHGQQFLLPRD
jgi:general secretion pathway protein B